MFCDLGWRVHSQDLHCTFSWCMSTFLVRYIEGADNEGCNRCWNSTNWAGIKCTKDNIEQCFGDYLQPGVQSATTYGFLIYNHVILDQNMGLAKRVAVTTVHILQDVFANFYGIMNEVAEGATRDHWSKPGPNNCEMAALPRLQCC